MALISRHKVCMDAIAVVLNANADIGSRNWTVRKKAYNRGKSWEPGGFIAPVSTESPYHENQQDEWIFKSAIVCCDPGDGSLVAGLADHMAAIEMAEAIFHFKGHGFMPSPIRAIDTTLASTSLPGKVQYCRVEFGANFIDDAFEAGYDASVCFVSIAILSLRLATP